MEVKKQFMRFLTGGLILTVLFVTGSPEPARSAPQKYPSRAMEFIAPAGAGGGWDVTIRTVAKTLRDTKLVSVPMPIVNRPGGGGGIALAYLQERKKSDAIIAVYSPPLLLINLSGITSLSYNDTTPLANLIADYGCFAVAKNSQYKTIQDVMAALKKDPKSVKICGTSAAGSMDHLQFLKMAKMAGVTNLKEINYISFQDNSGPAQVLGGHVDLISSGLADVRALVESGDLRALATTADKRVGKGVFAQIPTCVEQGIDATFVNWRGLFGAPGMPDYAVDYWRGVLKQLVQTKAWADVCQTNGWDVMYLDAPEFREFLKTTNEEYKSLLRDVGMLK